MAFGRLEQRHKEQRVSLNPRKSLIAESETRAGAENAASVPQLCSCDVAGVSGCG